MKLTDPQKRGLAYYMMLALPSKEARDEARKTLKLTSPRPQVMDALIEKGLLHKVGYSYGPLYGLTEAGVTEARNNPLKKG